MGRASGRHKKVYIKPKVPNYILTRMHNRRKEERFQRDREKLQGGW